MEFEECKLDRTGTTYHYVSGNPRVAKLPKSTEIVLDEKWRTDLKDEEFEVFERIAGSQNRRYGYGDVE